MEKVKFLIALIKNKYNKFTDYLYNMAWFYFELGYKEAKIFLFLYAIFKFNLKLYKIEKESFGLVVEDNIIKFLSGKGTYFYSYRSKIKEDIICYFRYIKYRILFSQNKVFNLLLIPYFLYKDYKINKFFKCIENYSKNSFFNLK